MDIQNNKKLSFVSDYMEGAHPILLEKLLETNMAQAAGYGLDVFSESARDKIRAACKADSADIFFISGGTQSNAIVISSLLRPYQGVIAAETGHISTHEAGAIEAGGHKVLTLSHKDGKLSSKDIKDYVLSFYEDDENSDHMVFPGMVYISHPTEYGTLYSLNELESISAVCREFNMPLYLDGARMAYALACPENDVSLADLARLCDVFYIGGTKCGALFGEAVVIPEHDYIPHFFTIIKQKGALLAKGKVAGVQFDALFTDDLYLKIGQNAIDKANEIRQALIDNGYKIAFPSPTNQLFVEFTPAQLERLSDKVEMAFWEKVGENSVMRIATSWATSDEATDDLIRILADK